MPADTATPGNPANAGNSGAPVLVEHGPVATIRLNRPDKFNAMNVEMGIAIAAAVAKVNADPDVRVVVVRGEGRAFCAGGDFDMIEANTLRSPEGNRETMVAFYGMFLSILDLRAPSVAVLHGATIGAGLCVALACDMRLAASEAKMGANFVRIGLHPGMGASLMLPQLLGRARSAELLLTGKLVLGDKAQEMGLVNASVPREQLDALVDETVSDLLAAAPIAAFQTKATLTTTIRRALWAALQREAGMQAIDFATEDIKTAIAAFRAKEPPAFRGA